ncbi:VOC family protein, partial [Streptomyces prasinopilosus]
AVVLDCADPRALAGFYAGLLGGTIEGEGDWVDLRVPGGPVLAFQETPGHVPPRWPSPDHSQQFHLDLTVEDL